MRTGRHAPWWAGHADVEVVLACGGERHALRWTQGRMESAHHDITAERALVALGAPLSACVLVVEAFRCARYNHWQGIHPGPPRGWEASRAAAEVRSTLGTAGVTHGRLSALAQSVHEHRTRVLAVCGVRERAYATALLDRDLYRRVVAAAPPALAPLLSATALLGGTRLETGRPRSIPGLMLRRTRAERFVCDRFAAAVRRSVAPAQQLDDRAVTMAVDVLSIGSGVTASAELDAGPGFVAGRALVPLQWWNRVGRRGLGVHDGVLILDAVTVPGGLALRGLRWADAGSGHLHAESVELPVLPAGGGAAAVAVSWPP